MRGVLSVGLFLVSVSACGGGSPTSPTPPRDLRITGPNEVMTGASAKYTAWATLSDGAITGATANWSTDNSAIATIDNGGVLLGQGSGTATITATWRGKSATATVRVSAEIAAKVYLDALFQIMEKKAVHTATIDWTNVREQASSAAPGARTIPDTFPAIRVALAQLQERESFYQNRNGVLIGGEPSCTAQAPAIPAVPQTIGYVRVEGCVCLGSSATRFAEDLQRKIKNADRADLSGWIVDLRGNSGGNMWPMIAGVGPVLGDGIMGWIVYNDREYEREYRGGEARSFGEALEKVAAPYSLIKENPRVAVLTDGSVISAGEALTVYFRGRPGTRSFGTSTCGHHDLLEDHDLSDGARLVLTTAQHADRLKTRYTGPIAPDELVSDSQQAVDRAIAWLQGRN